MAAKLYPSWKTEAKKTLDYLNRPKKVFPFEKTVALIDHLAWRKVVPRKDLLNTAMQINGGDGVDFENGIKQRDHGDP